MEYCPGVKISDTQALVEGGFSTEKIASVLTRSYMEQLCNHGFFHCDPHPGNLAVDDGDPGGRERLFWIPCVSPQMTSR